MKYRLVPSDKPEIIRKMFLIFFFASKKFVETQSNVPMENTKTSFPKAHKKWDR
nr:hypothetical protein [uncultured Allomuricauda sp.]